MPVSFLKRLKTPEVHIYQKPTLSVDVHTHILPSLDNGTDTIEESIAILRAMAEDGVRKVIATPHIMNDFYKNSVETIQNAKNLLAAEIYKRNIPIGLEVAAEYFVDVSFAALLDSKEPLLTFGQKYLLFETTIIGFSSFLEEVVNHIFKRGLKPVLAHPERYLYLQQNYKLAHQLHSLGILFQVNITSLESLHNPTRQLAEYLISEGLADFMGSNVHNQHDWNTCRKSFKSKYFTMAFERGILNETLLY